MVVLRLPRSVRRFLYWLILDNNDVVTSFRELAALVLIVIPIIASFRSDESDRSRFAALATFALFIRVIGWSIVSRHIIFEWRSRLRYSFLYDRACDYHSDGRQRYELAIATLKSKAGMPSEIAKLIVSFDKRLRKFEF